MISVYIKKRAVIALLKNSDLVVTLGVHICAIASEVKIISSSLKTFPRAIRLLIRKWKWHIQCATWNGGEPYHVHIIITKESTRALKSRTSISTGNAQNTIDIVQTTWQCQHRDDTKSRSAGLSASAEWWHAKSVVGSSHCALFVLRLPNLSICFYSFDFSLKKFEILRVFCMLSIFRASFAEWKWCVCDSWFRCLVTIIHSYPRRYCFVLPARVGLSFKSSHKSCFFSPFTLSSLFPSATFLPPLDPANTQQAKVDVALACMSNLLCGSRRTFLVIVFSF